MNKKTVWIITIILILSFQAPAQMGITNISKEPLEKDYKEVIQTLKKITEAHLMIVYLSTDLNNNNVEIIDGYQSKELCQDSGIIIQKSIYKNLQILTRSNQDNIEIFKPKVTYKCVPKYNIYKEKKNDK